MKSLNPWRSNRNIFDRVFSDFVDELTVNTRPWMQVDSEFSPRVDVRDSKKEIFVTAELPGLNEKDIQVTLADDRLVIKGEKRAEKELEDSESYYVERSFGAFTRSIPLPTKIDREKCDAKFNNGVLTVTLKKSKEGLTGGLEIPIHH